MVREVIEEEDQSINELIQDELSVFNVLNTMSLLYKIKLTNDDYLLITNIFNLNLVKSPEYNQP